MINARPTQNGEDATDLVAALLSNPGALRKQAARFFGDVGRLGGRIESMHRVADRLDRKIESTRVRIRILRLQYRLLRRKKRGPSRPKDSKPAVKSG